MAKTHSVWCEGMLFAVSDIQSLAGNTPHIIPVCFAWDKQK